MAKKRYNKIFGIFGKRGSGKTDYTIGNPEHDLEGLINKYLKRRIKVICIDTIDHPSWRQFPVITMDKFHLFKKGVVRIICNRADIPKLNKFLNEHPNTWNSVLIYEDARKHTFKIMDPSLVELAGDSKQKNIDMGFMYHNIKQAPPELFGYFDFIELFKTKSSPLVRKEYFDDIDEAMQTYNRIKEHPSQFYHELIDMGND